MPLVTKKNGIKKPKPTAVSFDSKTCSSWPFSASRGDHPGDEAAEQDVEAELARRAATRPKTRTTVTRTASWLLDSKVRSSAGQPRQAERTETRRRASSASDDEGEQDRRLVRAGASVERTSVTSRIGPNSPTPPAASR